MSPSRAARRVSIGVTAATALALAFAAGALTASSGRPAAPASPRLGVLDDAAAQISAQALRPVDPDALDGAAISAMLRAAGDPWGSWSEGDTPAGAAGIGVWLRTDRSGAIVLARVGVDTAASVAGLRPGDAVRSVDGRSTGPLTAPLVAAALRGPVGSDVRLTTERDGTVRSLVLRRELLQPDSVSADLESASRGATLVGHITVPSFARGTARAVAAVMTRLRSAHAAGLILDLRGNPGGLLMEAVQTAAVFLDGGPVVSYARRGQPPVRLAAAGVGDTSTPLVVLVDGGTASAAEVVAGALQDRGRAVLVGSRTFGKGTVQEPRTLADGSALELTVAAYATPSGRSVDGVGLAPDIEIPAGSAADVAVRRAWEVLSGLVADSTPVAGGRG